MTDGGGGAASPQMQHHQTIPMLLGHSGADGHAGPGMAQPVEAIASQMVLVGPVPRDGIGAGRLG